MKYELKQNNNLVIATKILKHIFFQNLLIDLLIPILDYLTIK